MPLVKKIIQSSKTAIPIGHFCQAVQIGETIYISGQLGRNEKYEIGEGIEKQTRLTMDSIGEILKVAGANFDNLVKVSIYLDDMNNFSKMNEIYSEYFGKDPPARVCFEASLPKGFLIEIEAVAEI